MSFVDLKLWDVKVIKSDVCEWRVFTEPVTYTSKLQKNITRLVTELLYSGLFSNQNFSHKWLNINFVGFIFEVGVYFEIFEAVYDDTGITKLSTVEQHCNYRCSVMLTHS